MSDASSQHECAHEVVVPGTSRKPDAASSATAEPPGNLAVSRHASIFCARLSSRWMCPLRQCLPSAHNQHIINTRSSCNQQVDVPAERVPAYA